MSLIEKDLLSIQRRTDMKSKVCLIFILLLSLLTNLVYANSVEIASVTAHYVHPVNNTVEDSGNNEEIGQGMTEAVLGPQFSSSSIKGNPSTFFMLSNLLLILVDVVKIFLTSSLTFPISFSNIFHLSKYLSNSVESKLSSF